FDFMVGVVAGSSDVSPSSTGVFVGSWVGVSTTSVVGSVVGTSVPFGSGVFSLVGLVGSSTGSVGSVVGTADCVGSSTGSVGTSVGACVGTAVGSTSCMSEFSGCGSAAGVPVSANAAKGIDVKTKTMA